MLGLAHVCRMTRKKEAESVEPARVVSALSYVLSKCQTYCVIYQNPLWDLGLERGSCPAQKLHELLISLISSICVSRRVAHRRWLPKLDLCRRESRAHLRGKERENNKYILLCLPARLQSELRLFCATIELAIKFQYQLQEVQCAKFNYGTPRCLVVHQTLYSKLK